MPKEEPRIAKTKVLPEIPKPYQGYASLFEDPQDWRALPEHQPWDHEINFKEGFTPPAEKLRHHNPQNLRILEEYRRKGVEKGHIRKSKSPSAVNMLIARKKEDPKGRPCGDYRLTNAGTIRDVYPIPNAQYLRDKLGKAKIYTKLDQRNAFNLIRIAKGQEWKTAFVLPSGLWEYTVMPFGLTNAPATCQRQNDEILRPCDSFAICYLDDILIYSEREEDHEGHVLKVLEALRKVDSRLKLPKCEFGVRKVTFLGYVIEPGRMSMDPEKIEAVQNWETPTNVKDVQSLLGFANFCRQFIAGYSEMVRPLTELTKKDLKFEWTPKCEAAFQEIKKRFTEAPILQNYDPDLQCIVESDASDTCMGAVLLQRGKDDKLHPTAYFSKKMSPPEQNYGVGEKELLGIIKCLKHWKPYLMGARHQVVVLTDHQNLRTFTTTKVLDERRLVRWAQELASFDILIKHIPGTENPRADALSRKPGYEGEKEYKRAAILRELKNGDLVPNVREFAAIERKITEPWKERLLRAQKATRPMGTQVDKKDGLVKKERKIWLPESIAEEFVTEQHSLPAHGHQGVRRTHTRISRNYWTPELKELVTQVVRNCDACIRNKSSRHSPCGQMEAVQVPEQPWSSISWDFIGPLPESEEPVTRVKYDMILIIMERLTKYMVLVPFRSNYTAQDLAQVFFREVVMKFGLPKEIISDRDKLFTSKFWTATTELLGVKRKLSTAFHPQSNGGNERMNQVVEAYLRCYVDYQQTNWVSLLPSAQFAYNSSPTETTLVSPFKANYGMERVAYREPGITTLDNETARLQTGAMKELHGKLRQELMFVAERNSHYYNQRRSQEPALKEGDRVYLLRRNINTKRPSDKLDHKKLGPYKIKKRKGTNSFELALPKTMNIHPVFHISLLEKAPEGAPPAPITEIQPVNPNAEYEVEELLDCQYRNGKPKYLVKWLGYPQSENTWEPKGNLNCLDLLAQFHQQNPGLPSKKTKGRNQVTVRPRKGRKE
jgi:transposase InsO family protein